jgi:hypothetical protein
MLSGEFSSINIEDIYIKRDDRIRKEVTPESIDSMAESITRCGGLIHPIILDREHTLVAGETRLSACKQLGWDRISFQYLDTLSEREQLLIELEENVRRKDLDWKDKCDALLKFHNMQVESEDVWTVSDTAKAVGYSVSATSEQLSVARAVVAGNSLVMAAPKLSTAKAIVSRQNEREASDMANAISTTAGPKKSNEILTVDFNLWAPSYSGTPFNFVHADLPYGINFQSTSQGAVAEHGEYNDSEDVYWKLLGTLLDNTDRLFAESSHLIFWFSLNFYQQTLDKLKTKFKVDPYPLIWFKSDNTGILPDFNRGPRRVYETAFFCSRGDRKIIQAVGNAVAAPGGDKVVGHASEKNEAMLGHFFRMIVDSNTRMLDPTCGSGSAVRVAKRMGAQSVLGLERDEKFAEDARRALG